MLARDFVNDIRENRLRYDIYNLSNLKDGEHDLVNRVYQVWYKIWYEVFNASQSLESLNVSSILQQNYLGVVRVDDEIIGFNYLSAFDLRLHYQLEAHYLKPFVPDITKHPHFTSIQRIHSIEYLTALPNMRKLYEGVSIGELLIRFSVHFSRSRFFDMLLGSTRSDISTTQTAERAGFKRLGRTIIKCKYPCDLVYYPLLKEPSEKNSDLAKNVEQVWLRSQDYFKTKK